MNTTMRLTVFVALAAIGCGEVTAMMDTDGAAGAGGSPAAGSNGAGGDGSGGSGGATATGGMSAPGTAGTGGALACGSTGQAMCPDGCVDTRTDNRNCGACGMKCPTESACVAGKCTCDRAGWIICGKVVLSGIMDQPHCINPMADTNYCGGCDTLCNGPFLICGHGTCCDGRDPSCNS